MFGTKIKTLELKVNGMSCHHCEMTVENGIKSIENVKNIKADHKDSKLTIQYEGNINTESIKNKIIELGYLIG